MPQSSSRLRQPTPRRQEETDSGDIHPLNPHFLSCAERHADGDSASQPRQLRRQAPRPPRPYASSDDRSHDDGDSDGHRTRMPAATATQHQLVEDAGCNRSATAPETPHAGRPAGK
jgi:hypothetical protein